MATEKDLESLRDEINGTILRRLDVDRVESIIRNSEKPLASVEVAEKLLAELFKEEEKRYKEVLGKSGHDFNASPFTEDNIVRVYQSTASEARSRVSSRINRLVKDGVLKKHEFSDVRSVGEWTRPGAIPRHAFEHIKK